MRNMLRSPESSWRCAAPRIRRRSQRTPDVLMSPMGLHMTYDEDRSQVRMGNEPRAMAVLRSTAIGLLPRLKLPNIQRTVNHLARHPKRVAALILS